MSMPWYLGLLVLLAGCSWFRRDALPACPPPFTALSRGTCVAIPPGRADHAPVLVFLHGMAPTAELAMGNAEALGRRAMENGIVAVAPVGSTGLCTWSSEVASHLCWPTNAQSHAIELRAFGEHLRMDLEEVRVRLGQPDDVRPVLAGFSNGGFAAAWLVASGTVRPVGLAVLHAGGPYDWNPRAAIPTLLRAARDDRWHGPTMLVLRDQLASVGWAARWQEREGGHAFTESDAAALIDFVEAVSGLVPAARPASRDGQ